ncbi:hypothetical protein IVA89_07690 [Bradyrhizobium sp. 150]|nr:hypothetical protein [Bradyrhizobium sp. 150]
MMTEHGTQCFRIIRKDGSATDSSIHTASPSDHQAVSRRSPQAFRRTVRFDFYKARDNIFATHPRLLREDALSKISRIPESTPTRVRSRSSPTSCWNSGHASEAPIVLVSSSWNSGPGPRCDFESCSGLSSPSQPHHGPVTGWFVGRAAIIRSLQRNSDLSLDLGPGPATKATQWRSWRDQRLDGPSIRRHHPSPPRPDHGKAYLATLEDSEIEGLLGR